MSLSPGSRLGPYEILAPLGAGGMGEVYRARDTRLGRAVAIKVLPADVASDAERLRRFEQEAKAVSALNHPHIVTLYEVGSSDFGPFLVLEKIEGQSLRDLLHSGALPVKRVLALGAQIAEGLAKAHAAGIVHRDLKPENVMVTEDGFAKILDFGLAKLVYPEIEGGAPHEMTTLVDKTASGMILGTLGYLSPEQAAGKPADFRSDQFALGALLYELATGERPFKRQTTPESLAAVIREEPEPLRAKNAALPTQLGWIVERCLAKDPNDRYASTRDLARDLADLRDRLSALSHVAADAPGSGARPARRASRWAWPVLTTALAGALGWAVVTRGPSLDPPSYRPLTFQRGIVTGARFAPDGKTIYYSAAWGGEPSRIFRTTLDGPEAEPLDLPPAILLSVSRRGELAVLLTGDRNPAQSKGTLARVPALGGSPRLLVEDAWEADWASDGERLLVRRGPDGDDLEFPLGKVLRRGVFWGRFSPAGDRIAWSDENGLEIADLAGKRLLFHENPFVFGLAWGPGGREVWFTGDKSGSGSERALFAVSLAGKERLVARAPGAMTLFDVAPDGRSALIGTGSGRFSVRSVRADRDGEQILDLYGRTFPVGLSADGKLVLLWEARSVGRGAHLRTTDGARSVRLGDDAPIGLSPDGAWALLYHRDPEKLTLVPTGPGSARELALDGLTRLYGGGSARWSLDGSRIFLTLAAVATGPERARIYVREGDRPFRPVTPEGVAGAFVVSPDGRTVAALDATGIVTLYPLDGSAPRPLDNERGRPVHWGSDGGWLWLRAPGALPARIYRRELATGRIEPWRTIGPDDPTGVTYVDTVLLAGNGETCIYNFSRTLGDLYLVEGLK